MEERIKYYIKIIIIAIIGIIIGFNTSVKKVEAQTYNAVDFRIYDAYWGLLANCNNTTYCDAYTSSTSGLDVRHFMTKINQNLVANQSYTIDVKVEYSIKTRSNQFEGLADMSPIDFQTRNGQDNFVERPTCLSGDTINTIQEYYWDMDRQYWYFEVLQHYTCTFKTTANANNIQMYQTFKDVYYLEGDIALYSYPTINATTTNQDVVDKIQNSTENIINNNNNNTNKILNEGTFVKPESDLKVKESEEKEEEIYDLFSGVDINAITIDFDSKSVTKIFELLNRIITQNTIIQTMIITILSISIIKLVLGR